MDFYQKIIKAEDDLQLANITAETRVENQVYVRKNPAPGQFSSIKDAIDSITTATQINPFQVIVGPGVYIEDTITMKPWVFVRGNRNSTVIQVDDPNKDVIIGSAFSEIHEVVLSGATGTGRAAVRVTDTIGGLFQVRECLFGENDCFVVVDAPVFGQITVLDSLVTSLSSFNTGFVLNGTGVCVGAFIGVNAIVGPGMSVDDFYLIETPTSTANISAGGVVVSGGTLTNGIRAYNGATVIGQAIAFMGATNAIVTDNTGAMPILQLGSTTVIGSTTTDLKLDHPTTAGFVTGAFDTSKISISSTAPISVTYTDPSANAGSGIVGSLLQGDSFDKITNISKLLRRTAPLGHFSGGTLSDGGGLTVDVAAGNGFIEDGTGVVREVNWNSVSGLAVSASASVLITVDSDGLVQAEATSDNIEKIILGGAVTDATGVVGLIDVPLDVNHHSNKIETTLTQGIGAIYASGSITSEKNIGSRDIAVTSGSYYFGSRVVMPSGADPVTWTAFRQDGGGGFTTASQSIVDNAQYDDGSGTLQAIPAGQFVKHSFYVVGTGATTSYFLVYGQQTFASLSAAETGPLPTPPGFFNQLVVTISSFIVEQGQSAIQQILDERPQLNKQASAVSPSSDHGNLSGLLDDDHSQYFRTDGTRVATGDFDMGTNDITNAGTYNGVTVEAHKDRHLPNGADPLDTATAVGLDGDTTNAEGIQNSFARSDHAHAIATGNVSTQTPDQANAEGTSANLARADHIHNIPADVASDLDADSTSTEGTNASFARSDHTHDLATGVVSTLNPDQANAEGSSANLARADHIHEVPTDTPVTLNPDQANDEGASSSFARADHVHNVPAAIAIGLSGDTANTEGNSTSFSRANHTHNIATGTPVTQTPDQVNDEGSAAGLARADHVHNIATGTAVDLSPASTSTEGISSSFARADHTHAIATSLVGDVTTIEPDDAADAGSADAYARGDHQHAIATEAPAANLSGNTTNDEGSATSFSRSDHSHNITTGNVSTQIPDQANDEGTSPNIARADHTHNIPAETAVSLDAASVSAEGTNSSFARSDHTHAIGTALVGDITSIDAGDAADAGSSNNYSRGDHQHAVNTAAPVTINPDQVNTEGVSTNLARADHIHNIPAATAVGLNTNSTNTEGNSTSFARANHTHALQMGLAVTLSVIEAGDVADAGTASGLVRADHQHAVATGNVSSIVPAQANAEGASGNLARADHIHNIPVDAAVTLTASSSNTEGIAATFSRSDHTHNLDTGVVSTQTPDQANAEGVSGNLARADHIHNIPAGAPGVIEPDAIADEGGAASFSRSDHVHSIVTAAPTGNINANGSNSEGSASTFARSDHDHDVDTDTPLTLQPDQGNQEGTGSALARADHIHDVPAGTAVSLSANSTNQEGVVASFSRSDHTHDLATGVVSTVTPDQANAEGVSANLARADHIHNIPAAVAVGLTANSTNQEGNAASFARSNHTHDLATGVVSTITPELANAEGTSANLARADHIHNIPSGTPVNTGDTNAEGTASSFARTDHEHATFPVFQFDSVGTDGSTTAATTQTLTTANLPAGTYRVGWYKEFTHTDGGNDWEGQVLVGATVIADINYEFDDATSWTHWSGFHYIALSGVNTITMTQDTEAGGTASSRRRRLEIMRVA